MSKRGRERTGKLLAVGLFSKTEGEDEEKESEIRMITAEERRSVYQCMFSSVLCPFLFMVEQGDILLAKAQGRTEEEEKGCQY